MVNAMKQSLLRKGEGLRILSLDEKMEEEGQMGKHQLLLPAVRPTREWRYPWASLLSGCPAGTSQSRTHSAKTFKASGHLLRLLEDLDL